jgi:hypothetical protein
MPAAAILGPRRRSIVSSMPTTSGPVGANVATSRRNGMRPAPKPDQTARLADAMVVREDGHMAQADRAERRAHHALARRQDGTDDEHFNSL